MSKSGTLVDVFTQFRIVFFHLVPSWAYADIGAFADKRAVVLAATFRFAVTVARVTASFVGQVATVVVVITNH